MKSGRGSSEGLAHKVPGSAAIVSLLGHALPATRRNRLVILIYHRVRPRPDPMFPLEVDAERFDWQMGALRRHCEPLSLSKAVEGLRRGVLPSRAVAVTFDDGYADNATIAVPILRRHQVPATFFVATGYLDGGRMWNDSIIETVRATEGDVFNAESIGLGRIDVSTPQSRGRAAESLIQAVKRVPFAEREAKVCRLAEAQGLGLPVDLMMTSSQVRAAHEAGIEIGAHTVSHPILRTLTDGEAQSEIADSRSVLERITGSRVTAFAYPNGRPGADYTERDRQIVESLGFDYAVSTRAGAATLESDVLQLPRFTPWDTHPSRWLGRLLATYRSAA